MSDIIVVGGGIAGSTAAYALTKRGARVVLLEQRVIAAAASGRNMGFLLNEVDVEAYELMRLALPVYQEIARGPVPFGLRETDMMLVPQDEQQLDVTRRRADALRAHGLDCKFVDEQELRADMPQLRRGLPGGYRLPGVWMVDPAAATHAFAEAARAAGASIRTGVRVSQLALRSGRCEGVHTDAGALTADAVILATGPWLQELLASAPVFAGRGWLLRTGSLDFKLPWVLAEMAWPDLDELGRAARPPTLSEVAAGAYDKPVAATVAVVGQPAGDAVIGTSLAPSLRDPVEGVDMPSRIASRALDLLPGLKSVSVTASWYGMRPMSPDGLPLVGATPTDGLFIHTGHGSIGMQAAPATAGWLADLILQGKRAPELERLRPERFN